MSARPVPRVPRPTTVSVGLVALCTVLAGCTSNGEDVSAHPRLGDEATAQRSGEPVSAASVRANIRDDARGVAVDETLRLRARDGAFEKVTARIRGGEDRRLGGRLSADGDTWTSTERLEPGLEYQVRAVAEDTEGLSVTERSSFRTDDLTLDDQTFPSIAPLEGETVGVGMPVIVKFDVPVTDRAAIERHLSVETSPRQAGSWHWLGDTEVHWRPKSYWQPGTEVTVNADINSVDAGNGVYGQLSRSTSFTIGDAIVSKIDVSEHSMKVYRNGDLLRTLPISAGKKGFTTRSGTKVIMSKHRRYSMDAATIGIDEDDPEYYDIEDVEYAMRLTYSGEFLHAAPWSVGSQGETNVSHGCVGMSSRDAAWLFGISHRGDVVEVTGTERQMEPGNGYTDWNQSFREYRTGSAL